jgi:hypothetical protein
MNISKAVQAVLLAVWSDKDIMSLPADKGNVTVILLSEDYCDKIKTVLSDPTYRKQMASFIKMSYIQRKLLTY